MATAGVHVVQMRVGWDADTNAGRILDLIADARQGDVVVTPEGSLSGYPISGHAADLARIDLKEVEDALNRLEEAARERGLILWAGRLRMTPEGWVNEAVGLSADKRRIYRKRNLAEGERATFLPGAELPIFGAGQTQLGVQICRELRFPEQWTTLASKGAEVLAHMNHAVGAPAMYEVWRSMLIARALETQRWVVSANAADAFQHCRAW